MTATSPHGPAQHDEWGDPLLFRDEAEACTDPPGRPDAQAIPAGAPPRPMISARRAGKNVFVSYDIPSAGKRAKSWLLVVTVDGFRDGVAPTGRRVVLAGANTGTVRVPIGLSKGPLRITASVRAASGARSKIAVALA
jgi:hypothetical protein